MKPRRAGAALLGAAHAASALAFLFAIPRHVVDASWPPHARNHVLQALFWVMGFHGVSLMIV